MEFSKEKVEAIIQQCIKDNLAPHLVNNGELEEGHRVLFIGECEALQSYFVDLAAQGFSYKEVKAKIRLKIEELKAQIDREKAHYLKYYPPIGHTTETVIHLIPGSPEDTEDDLTTWKRTPEERSNIPSPALWHFVRFKNTVLINFLEFIIKEFRQREAEAQLPSREEVLKQEARAKAILQQAQELAETKLQAFLNDILPVETLEFIQEETARIRRYLKQTNKPQYHSDTGHSYKVLAGAFLTYPQICALPDNHFIEVIAGRIAGKRYIAHLKDLADKAQADAGTQQTKAKKGPGKQDFRPGPELTEKIRGVLQARGLLADNGKYIGDSTQVKALYNVIFEKGLVSGTYKEEGFAEFFFETFQFYISGRTLQNPANDGQKEEETEFKALF